MCRILRFACAAALAAALPAQGFECQSGTCLQVFPSPRGAPGDCDGVSWNGLGLAGVDSANGAGFPTAGVQYLRVRANGPENVAPGVVPATFSGNAAEVYVPVPAGATATSFAWDFYNAEGALAPFNDGMLIDVIDLNGNRLSVLRSADTTSPLGSLLDATSCSGGSPGIDLAAAGPELVTNAPLPAGAAFLRIAVWNGTDNLFPSEGVADAFSFAVPPATYPGTGGDLVLRTGVTPGPAPHAYPALTTFPDVKSAPAGALLVLEFRSPQNSLASQPIFIAFNVVPTVAMPPADPLLLTLGIQVRPGFQIVTLFGFVPALPPGGSTFNLVAPPGIGGLSLLIQGAVVTPLAPNGVLFSTDAHEIRF